MLGDHRLAPQAWPDSSAGKLRKPFSVAFSVIESTYLIRNMNSDCIMAEIEFGPDDLRLSLGVALFAYVFSCD